MQGILKSGRRVAVCEIEELEWYPLLVGGNPKMSKN
jgi:hypothetical protein